MEIIRPGTHVDFMRFRKPVALVSLVLVVASLVSLFVPGPNYGIDFKGGTELQLAFQGRVSSGELRQQLERLGYSRPDVVAVEGEQSEFIVRIAEVSSITPQESRRIKEALGRSLGDVRIRDFEVSPGGDKIAMTLSGPVELDALRAGLEQAGADVREVAQFGQTRDNRYEAYLIGVGDEVVQKLRETLGSRGPETPRRIEWVGPKAGAQLRDAAIKAILYAIAFIMVYVAFRFDLRFAPGAVVAMLHDPLITLGVFVALQKEVNLTTVAALLTIVGYSINDTIVVYDRIRENMGRMREKSLSEIINVSTSQMLSRTVITSGTTLLSVSAFFLWGTAVIRDITFALFIGIIIGTYSSIYVAAPITEYLDRRVFSKGRKKK